MAASASVTIPVTATTPTEAYDLREILDSTPGTQNIAIDAAAGTATFGYQFPGNIDATMRRLTSHGLRHGDTIKISVPVKNLSGNVIDSAQLLQALGASPAVQDAAYDGKTVSATILGATNAMRYVYEEILIAGLTAIDIPTVAGQQEFVL